MLSRPRGVRSFPICFSGPLRAVSRSPRRWPPFHSGRPGGASGEEHAEDVITEYERRFLEKGQPIYRAVFVKNGKEKDAPFPEK